MKRPISVDEAAKILGISKSAVMKSIRSGKFLAVLINARGYGLCRQQVEGKPFSESAFRRLCDRYISIPDACEIVCKTDASVGRDLVSGRLIGFKLNGRAWAVDRRSAQRNIAEYLANTSVRGQPRRLGESRSPRVLRKKSALPRGRKSVRSRP